MPFVVIDGDDIGRRITSFYLSNDADGLSSFVDVVHGHVLRVTNLLANSGHKIIFSAADGVVAEIAGSFGAADLYRQITDVDVSELTFSVGVGDSLREAYVALLAAKSHGKARLYHYSDLDLG